MEHTCTNLNEISEIQKFILFPDYNNSPSYGIDG